MYCTSWRDLGSPSLSSASWLLLNIFHGIFCFKWVSASIIQSRVSSSNFPQEAADSSFSYSCLCPVPGSCWGLFGLGPGF